MANKNSDPLVSIVIPVYNGSNYIENAIQSALNQTYKNIEIIVVNDGSTDDTENIVRKFGDKIKYFNKENGGVATALNLAIENMKGEYFSWLSHDDEYLPTKIEKQLEAINNSGDKYSLCYTEYFLDIVNMDIIKGVDYEEHTPEQVSNLKYLTLFGLINGCTLMFHKKYFDDFGLFDTSLLTSQDYDMWLRMFQNTNIILVKEKLVTYRVHNGQVARKIGRFAEELDNMNFRILNSITESEINKFYNNPATLYLKVLNSYGTFFKVNSLPKTFKYCYEKLFEFYNKDISDLRKLETLQNRIYNFGNVKIKRICVFGVGEVGQSIQIILQKYLIKVDYFCDNNKNIWGKLVNNVEVISPEDLSLIKDDTLVIIGSNYYSEDINNQLKSMGFRNIYLKSLIDDMLNECLYHIDILKLEYEYLRINWSQDLFKLEQKLQNTLYDVNKRKNKLSTYYLTANDILDANIEVKLNKQNLIQEISKDKNVKNLMVFGVGVRGIKLNNKLISCGIKVDLFSDNNKSKYGYVANDVYCYDINDIINKADETLVIVSMLNPESVINQLNDLKFKYICVKEDIDKVLLKYLEEKININYEDKSVNELADRYNELIVSNTER